MTTTTEKKLKTGATLKIGKVKEFSRPKLQNWTAYYEQQVLNNAAIFTLIAVSLYPVFNILDYLFIHEYWLPLLGLRLAGSSMMLIAYILAKQNKIPKVAVGYVILLVISISVTFMCTLTGEYLYIYNINTATLYLVAAAVTAWHWKHSVILFFNHVFVYSAVFFFAGFDFVYVVEHGILVLIISALTWVSFNVYRYLALIREFDLKYQLEQANEGLIDKNKEIVNQNEELVYRQNNLVIANTELSQKNEEIMAQKEMIEVQKEEIESTFQALQHVNKQLGLSIKSAKAIQTAILPTKEKIKGYFEEAFILFRPRDVVSGDFYWFKKKPTGEAYLILSDCTGHGIPGAFMSMVGHSLLREAITVRGFDDPAKVLAYIHVAIVNLFHQSETDNSDGMDISICKIIPVEGETGVRLTFAGAKSSIFIYNHQNLVEVKGDRVTIGGITRKEQMALLEKGTSHDALDQEMTVRSNQREFTNQNFDLNKGDYIYLLTDGYKDQNNAAGKSFGSKNTWDLLTEMTEEDFQTQEKMINGRLDEFKGSVKQRDDISVIGVRL